MMVKIRNNSLKVRGFPAIADQAGKVPGPKDAITVFPGETKEIDSERLKMYESKAFMEAFKEREDGRRPDLEILAPTAPVRGMREVLAQYEIDHKGKVATNPVESTLDAKITPHVAQPRGGQAETGLVPGENAPTSAVDIAGR